MKPLTLLLLLVAVVCWALFFLALLSLDSHAAAGPPDPDTQKYFECRYHGPAAPDARTPGCVKFRPHRQVSPFRPKIWASMEMEGER